MIRRKKLMPKDIKYLGVPNICFSLTKSEDNREKMFSKQRMSRGFDNSETWSLRDTISNFIIPRLKVFKEITIAYPTRLETMDKWQEILDQMIKSFELVSAEGKGDIFLGKKDMVVVNRGLRLFKEYFFDLWW